MVAANLSRALVKSRAYDDGGNVVSDIMFSILRSKLSSLTLFPMALKRLSISTASTIDALAMDSTEGGIDSINPPPLLPPNLDHVYDHNNDDNVEQLAVDPLADGVDAVVAPGVGEVEASPIEPSVVGAEGREMDAANLLQTSVESCARNDVGNVVSKIMFSISRTACISF
jgi:hypothetical protein